MRSTNSERLKPWVTGGCCCSWSTASVRSNRLGRLQPPRHLKLGPALTFNHLDALIISNLPSPIAGEPAQGPGSRRGGIAGAPARGRAARAGFPCRGPRPPGVGWLRPVGVLARRCPSGPPFHSAGRSMNRRTDRPAGRPPSSVLPPPDSSPRRSIHARPGPVSVAPRAPSGRGRVQPVLIRVQCPSARPDRPPMQRRRTGQPAPTGRAGPAPAGQVRRPRPPIMVDHRVTTTPTFASPSG